MKSFRITMLSLGMAFMAVAGLGRAYAGANSAPPAPVIYVTTMAVYPGDAISEDMITTRPLSRISGAAAYVTHPDQVVGKVAKHALLPGQPIAKTALREPYVITQGKITSVVFQSGPLTITGLAVALESGSAGDIISARNQDSGLIIKGQVQTDGSIKVDAP